jgi:hypothetical protein
MITPKTKALLVAMTLLGAAPAAIPALADNTSIVSIEDNDEVKQENEVKVKQKCDQENESNDAFNLISIDPQTNACANTAVVVANNNNEDNDANVVVTAQDDRDICDVVDVLTLGAEFVDC